MSGHTPGPWTVQGRAVHHLMFEEPLRDSNEVARVPNDNPESLANTRLLAAAPELAAALQLCFSELERLVRDERQSYDMRACKAAVEALRNAGVRS